MAYAELDELVAGHARPPAAAFLRAAVRARQSIVFAGAPGAGKTTLRSCCAAELDPSLRVVVAEDVFEIDVPLPNVREVLCEPACPEERPGPRRSASPASASDTGLHETGAFNVTIRPGFDTPP